MMADPVLAQQNAAPDLSNLRQATIAASTAKVQEYQLAVQAMTAGDLAAQAAHSQAYQSAQKVDIAAEKLLELTILNSPGNQQQLAALQNANQQLTAATKAIAATTSALNTFIAAANAVLGILALIAAA
jgi:hypothetical protein